MDELENTITHLDSIAKKIDSHKNFKVLKKLEKAVDEIGKSFSGSWLGYQSRVYYKDFALPPTGAVFSSEYGLMLKNRAMGVYSRVLDATVGDWREYDDNSVREKIYELAGSGNLDIAIKSGKSAAVEFDCYKSELLSQFEVEVDDASELLRTLLSELMAIEPHAPDSLISNWRPSAPVITRDTRAGTAILVPAHLSLLAEIESITSIKGACERAALTARKILNHRNRLKKKDKTIQSSSSKIFIGHGRSLAWRDLKDFLQDRLGLEYDEFNRESAAGLANVERLTAMLDSAVFAFLVLTAEDETAEEKHIARLNVIHETGLFQGRLGFKRAIVLLEEGCEQFSNIEGLGQIRFPRGDISAKFEDIRRVLERENVIVSAND